MERSKSDDGGNREQYICLRDNREMESAGLEVGVEGQ